MQGELARMMDRWAQPGQVTWIGLRPARRGAVVPADRAEVSAEGLCGDHGRGGKRAVTLLQAEHLPVLAAFLGRDGIAPGLLRRNLLVAGLNLSALRGRRIVVGTAVLELTGPCAPCCRMEEALGPGGYSALRGHGGWCASVAAPGTIALGDAVRPVAPPDEGTPAAPRR